MAGMWETTKNVSQSLSRCRRHPKFAPICRRMKLQISRPDWLLKEWAGAISHEPIAQFASMGTRAPETSVKIAYHFASYSVFYCGDVVRDEPGLVGLSQGLGGNLSMAGAAAAGICLALR